MDIQNWIHSDFSLHSFLTKTGSGRENKVSMAGVLLKCGPY